MAGIIVSYIGVKLLHSGPPLKFSGLVQYRYLVQFPYDRKPEH